MNKKYIFNTEAEAETMILALAQLDEDGNLPNFRDVKRTEATKGIVVLGFQDKIEIDEETLEETVIAGLTFNVDIAWITVNEDWSIYEVFPETSNHNFL
tara:strand:- start:133 stop:429 length:297 start_codon:yes stop_codon:yes gene_type:complete